MRLIEASNTGITTMRFYNSVGPNPRVVRMFMAERGIEIPRFEQPR
jgi:hypothetical protein